MITHQKAFEIRRMIVKASEALSVEDALQSVELYEKWQVGKSYAVDGKRYRHGSELYTCRQPHTSQSDWTPDVTPALWERVSLEEIEVWRQPEGAHDAYRIGKKVYYPTREDNVYENDIDYNVYAPDVAGWHLVTE